MVEPISTLNVFVFKGPSFSSLDATAKNIGLIKSFVKEASSQLCHLCIFPECFLQGYAIGRKEVFRTGELVEGMAFDEIRKISEENNNIAILYGYNELEKKEGEEKVFNCINVVTGKEGLIGHYRKTHLYSDYERNIWTPARSYRQSTHPTGRTLPPIFSYLGRRIGLLICYDFEFPEPTRCLCIDGAEIIIAVAANNDIKIPERFAPVRAQENMVFAIYANRYGNDDLTSNDGGINAPFCGRSIACGIDGDNLNPLVENENYFIVKFDFTLECYQRCFKATPYFNEKRPELYSSITKPNSQNIKK